jgi:putative peptide zinc metalloprotease protein
MEKSKLIPICSKDLVISKFDKESYYIHQTTFDYRLKISDESHEILLLANGKNNLEDIKQQINDAEIDIEFLEDFYFQNLAKYGIIENEELTNCRFNNPLFKISFCFKNNVFHFIFYTFFLVIYNIQIFQYTFKL